MTDQISFSPLRDLPPGHHEARKQHLLSEIARAPEWYRGLLPSPSFFDRWRSWRGVLATGFAVAALVGAGVGLSTGLSAGPSRDAFDGISAVQHPQTAKDVIDPATAAYMEDKNCNGPGEHYCQGMVVGLRFDTARHIGQLPDGQNIYLLSCAHNSLCTVLGPPHPTWQVNSPLSNSHPVMIFGYLAVNDSDPAANRWFTFGVALDGVTSVSFSSSTQATPADGGGPLGPGVTVPVHDNLWIYQSDQAPPPTVLQPVTAHFADGTSVTEPATGANCAAC